MLIYLTFTSHFNLLTKVVISFLYSPLHFLGYKKSLIYPRYLGMFLVASYEKFCE